MAFTIISKVTWGQLSKGKDSKAAVVSGNKADSHQRVLSLSTHPCWSWELVL